MTHRRTLPRARRAPLGRFSASAVTSAAAMLAASLVLAGCAFGPPSPQDSGAAPNLPAPSPSQFSPDDGDNASAATILASKLPQPWGIAFLPDGSALVTERRSGQIVKVAPPVKGDGTMTVTGYTSVDGVDASGDGGLLGVAASPHYKTDGTIYVYYSTARDNRVAVLAPDKAPHVIVSGIPHGTTGNGGALAFGPDGMLYASTGDAGHPATAQNPASLAGKILRVTTSGKPAAGTTRVYALGFHDVTGFAWDSHKHLYATDASHTGATVLDLVGAGANYGWPDAGTVNAPANAHYAVPILSWPAGVSGCAGVAVLDDVVATACLSGQRLWLAQLTAKGGTFGAATSVLAGKYGRLRAIAAAPDGSFWFTTSNTDNTDSAGTHDPADDRLIRIVISGAGAGIT